MIKHISFDVWNTLVKPNHQFAKARQQLLAASFRLDELWIKKVYTETKSEIDSNAENNGIGPSSDDCYRLLFQNLNVEFNADIKEEVETLFQKFPPIIPDIVKSTIEQLRSSNITLNISSNSNFISGNVMLPFLESNLGEFNFSIFSDLIGVSKPSERFFEAVKKRCTHPVENMLHVGDNTICDGYGATKSGIKSLIVSCPEHIHNIYETYKICSS